jgi:hypothetical protein
MLFTDLLHLRRSFSYYVAELLPTFRPYWAGVVNGLLCFLPTVCTYGAVIFTAFQSFHRPSAPAGRFFYYAAGLCICCQAG